MAARPYIRIATIVFGLAASVATAPADAQIVVGRGGGGLSIGIPGVGGIRLGAPVRYRGVYTAPYGAAPYSYGYGRDYYSRPYYGRVPRYAARPIISAQSLPTAGELQAMGDSALLNAIVDVQAQLDYELQRYDTAATWQAYLRLPEDALPPATDDGRVMLGMGSIAETLKRFNLTEANPRYVQIASLPSFGSMHAALGELASRMGEAPLMASDSPLSEPATNRIVPPPVPTPPQPSSIAASHRDAYEPRSIEMRNLHAAPREAEAQAATASDVGDLDQLKAQPASTEGEAEQLPSPPPSLVAPQNQAAEERSILSR